MLSHTQQSRGNVAWIGCKEIGKVAFSRFWNLSKWDKGMSLFQGGLTGVAAYYIAGSIAEPLAIPASIIGGIVHAAMECNAEQERIETEATLKTSKHSVDVVKKIPDQLNKFLTAEKDETKVLIANIEKDTLEDNSSDNLLSKDDEYQTKLNSLNETLKTALSYEENKIKELNKQIQALTMRYTTKVTAKDHRNKAKAAKIAALVNEVATIEEEKNLEIVVQVNESPELHAAKVVTSKFKTFVVASIAGSVYAFGLGKASYVAFTSNNHDDFSDWNIALPVVMIASLAGGYAFRKGYGAYAVKQEIKNVNQELDHEITQNLIGAIAKLTDQLEKQTKVNNELRNIDKLNENQNVEEKKVEAEEPEQKAVTPNNTVTKIKNAITNFTKGMYNWGANKISKSKNKIQPIYIANNDVKIEETNEQKTNNASIQVVTLPNDKDFNNINTVNLNDNTVLNTINIIQTIEEKSKLELTNEKPTEKNTVTTSKKSPQKEPKNTLKQTSNKIINANRLTAKNNNASKNTPRSPKPRK